MAWYNIDGSCGHTFRKQLYGKISGRENYRGEPCYSIEFEVGLHPEKLFKKLTKREKGGVWLNMN